MRGLLPARPRSGFSSSTTLHFPGKDPLIRPSVEVRCWSSSIIFACYLIHPNIHPNSQGSMGLRYPAGGGRRALTRSA